MKKSDFQKQLSMKNSEFSKDFKEIYEEVAAKNKLVARRNARNSIIGTKHFSEKPNNFRR